MSNEPNYREFVPDPDKPRTEYTWRDRRSELYDRIEKVGTWRNLPKSLRALGREYDVAHTTIRNDIDSLLEWEGSHLSDDTEANLSLLEKSASKDLTDAARYKRQQAANTDNPEERAKYLKQSAELKQKAYRLARNQLDAHLATGEIERPADKVDLDADVDSDTTVSLDDDDRELALEFMRERQARDAENGDESIEYDEGEEVDSE